MAYDVSKVDEESGVGTGRLFGICVVHPRLLSGSHTSDHDGVGIKDDFEAPVCYCFITRFPFFDFFFQVLFDLTTCERLQRMELMSIMPTNDEPTASSSHREYSYLPRACLEGILEKLSLLPPPKYGGTLSFTVSDAMPPNSFRRQRPVNSQEYMELSSDWSLPTLLSWMPVETLVRAVGLLLCEAKVIVVGKESGMVSCGVMGLLSLMKPLTWVAPVVPVLPLKHMEIVESPVPIGELQTTINLLPSLPHTK